MGNKVSSKEDVLAALELVVKNFLSPEYVGRWVSVKERSVGNMLKEIGVDTRYSTAVYEVLKDVSMIEKDGERGGLRYKIVTDIIPDSRGLAEKIFNLHRDSVHQASNSSSVLETRKGDLVPYKPRRTTTLDDIERRETAKKRCVQKTDYSRIPHLGQIVYALVNGYITEARITCVRFDDNNKVKVNFDTAIIEQVDDSDTSVVKRSDYCLRNIAFSVDELVKKLTTNVKKFNKK